MVEAAHERTFVMIRPDGVQKNRITTTMQLLEQVGDIKLCAIKLSNPSRSQLEQYHDLTPGRPLCLMVWEGNHAVTLVHNAIQYNDGLRDAVYAAESTQSASARIASWFKPSELCDLSSSGRVVVEL